MHFRTKLQVNAPEPFRQPLGTGIMSMSEEPRRAVFLDRDGTLNGDTGYVHSKQNWQWLPGVVETLKRFHAVGGICLWW